MFIKKKKFYGTLTDGDIRRGLTRGIELNDNYNRTDITIGLGFKVAKGAMFKADYQIKSNAESDKKSGQFNFGTAVSF